ncbi:protein of unknown function [Hyphomicrobium sp. 1Nfss2.1]
MLNLFKVGVYDDRAWRYDRAGKFSGGGPAAKSHNEENAYQKS